LLREFTQPQPAPALRDFTDMLFDYMDSLHPIFYINHNNPHILDNLLARAAEDDTKIEMYDNALGWLNHDTAGQKRDLAQFLEVVRPDGFDGRLFLALYDIRDDILSRSDITALLKRIAINNVNIEGYDVTVFIVSPGLNIAGALSGFVTFIDVKPPDEFEIMQIIARFGRDNEIGIKSAAIRELAVSLTGLDEFQIRQVLSVAYQDGGDITLADKALVAREKRQMTERYGLFKYADSRARYYEVGGLYTLMGYLKEKAAIFKDLSGAAVFGADIPKGIFIAGMPGCGKSLAAQAAADLFGVPLIRLTNTPKLTAGMLAAAPNLFEIISPCVLLIDGLDRVAPLPDEFYSWLTGKNNAAFVIATANDITKVPPEYLNKNCFDDLFYIGLPSHDERREILSLHINKRKRTADNINLSLIAHETEGLCGADLEGIVKSALQKAFAENRRALNTDDLLFAASRAYKKRQGETINLPENINFINANAKIKTRNNPMDRGNRPLFEKKRWLSDRRLRADRRERSERRAFAAESSAHSEQDTYEDNGREPQEDINTYDPLAEAIAGIKNAADNDADLMAFFAKIEQNGDL